MRVSWGLSRLRLSSIGLQTRQFASVGGIRRTALYDFHVKEHGQMVEFGGYEMPLQYKGQSIIASVAWTRHAASLFDVHSRLYFRINDRWGICSNTSN
jgi:aminomethyltransferase